MRNLVILLLLLTSIGTFAQKAPLWVDYAYRNANYPDSKYLVGFTTEINIPKERVTQAYEKLNQLARNQIIESIHVSIQAESQMNVSVENTKTDELFEMSSQSASKAELVGLKFENYYDKKELTAYSFSFVLIRDIITYYLDVIASNTDIINKNSAGIQGGTDKNTAFRLLYDTRLKLKEIDQAIVILTAMKQSAGVDFDTITGMKRQVEDFNAQLFASAPVTVENIAGYLTYNLILQLEPGVSQTVCEGKLAYKDSGAESDYSQALKKSVFTKIGSESTLKTGASGESCEYLLNGTFQDSDNDVTTSIALTNSATGSVMATVDRTIPKSAINLDGMRLLPPNFNRIKDIPNIKLNGSGDEIVIKTSEFIDNPISFDVLLNGQPQIDIPVKYNIDRDGANVFKGTVISDKSGKTQLFLNKESIRKSGEFELQVSVDVAAFLALNPASEFYQSVVRDYPPQVAKVKLKVIAPTVYVHSTEMNLGNEMTLQILAPAIKNALLDEDYKFVDNVDNADYTIEIVAATREGQKNGNMHFSYLDATIAMNSMKTGKEIYKNGLTSVKGAGSDYNLASVKAYEMARDRFLKDFLMELGTK